MTLRVVLADDHDLVRTGFRSLIQGFSGIEVVGEAAEGRHTLELVAELRPDIVLLDLAMPGMNGFEVLARMEDTCPETRVVVLSMYRDEEFAARVFREGAMGYLTKDVSADELSEALWNAARGVRHLAAVLSMNAVRKIMAKESPNRLSSLTPRQREVLQLVAEGHTSREIAKKLGISPKTVEVHRSNVMERLDIHDLAGLVRYAVAEGVVGDRP